MVSLALLLACASPPPPHLPATRDGDALAAAIGRLSPEERVALRPTLERWAVVGWREDVPAAGGEVILSERVAREAVGALDGQEAALPLLLTLVDGRQAHTVIAVIAEFDGGCDALAKVAAQGFTPLLANAFRPPPAGWNDCRPALAGYDTPAARALKEGSDVAP